MAEKPAAATPKKAENVEDMGMQDDEKKSKTTSTMSSAEPIFDCYSRENTSKDSTLESGDPDSRTAEKDALDVGGSDTSQSSVGDLDLLVNTVESSARDMEDGTAPAEVAPAASSWAVLAPLILSGSATTDQKLQGLACIGTSGVNLRVARRRITAVLKKSLQDADEGVRDAAVDAAIRMAGSEYDRMYEYVKDIHDAVQESFELPYKGVPSALHRFVLKVLESGDGVFTNLLGVVVLDGSLGSLEDESMASVEDIVSFLKRSLATTPPIYRVFLLPAIEDAFNHTVLAPAAFNAFTMLIPDLINLAHELIEDENGSALECLKSIAEEHLHAVVPFRPDIVTLCEKIGTEVGEESAERRAVAAELRARIAVNEDKCEYCERIRTLVPRACSCSGQDKSDEED